VQLLKIDLRSFLEHFAWCLKFGEGGFGRLGCATIGVWSFSSFHVVLDGFPGLQEVSCCVGLILAYFESVML